MDSSWQAFKVAEVGNSRWVIWGVQACYFNVKYTQKGKTYGNRFEDNRRLSSQFKHLHLLKCDGNFFSSKHISQKHQANMSLLWKLLNPFLPDPQELFWATLDFPESQSLLTSLSVHWLTNLFPSGSCLGGHNRRAGWCVQRMMIHTLMFCGTGMYLSIKGNRLRYCVFLRSAVVALQCVVLVKLKLFFFPW